MQNRSIIHWLIFIVLGLTWGSSFILMKRGLDSFTSDQVAAIRIFTAFLFLLPIAYRHVKRELLPKTFGFAGMGIFGNLLPAFMFTKAETMISSALTGMLNSLTPVFTLLIGFFAFRQKARPMQVIGIIVGLAGAVGLLLLKNEKNNVDPNLIVATGTIAKNVVAEKNLIWIGGALVVLATFFYGLSVNIIKSKLSGVSAVTATVCAMCIIGPIAGVYLFTTDFIQRMHTMPLAWESLGYVSILAIFGTALSVIVYNMLIIEAGTLFAASVTYIIPIVAIMWGLFDGENVFWMHGVYIAVILSGVWLVNKRT
ncbi:MAG TPA: DMT family transporter [Bacteroidia bacterium]|nr:DMT family transporter [Bacteroidia bacterium]